jgi:hypothetical protein
MKDRQYNGQTMNGLVNNDKYNTTQKTEDWATGIQWPINKGNNKITELRTILQRESQNS